jgi:MSHA pilin protein MshC
MIELIVTMIVIGIMAVVVMPRLDLLKGFDEIGYRDKVRATVEFARKSAVASRRYVCLAANGNGLLLTRDIRDPDSLTLATISCPNGTAANRLALPVADTKYCGAATNGNEICAPGGVTLTAPATNMVFSPLGRPTGTSNCTSAGSPAYCYTVTGTSPQTVTVESETGYVH